MSNGSILMDIHKYNIGDAQTVRAQYRVLDFLLEDKFQCITIFPEKLVDENDGRSNIWEMLGAQITEHIADEVMSNAKIISLTTNANLGNSKGMQFLSFKRLPFCRWNKIVSIARHILGISGNGPEAKYLTEARPSLYLADYCNTIMSFCIQQPAATILLDNLLKGGLLGLSKDDLKECGYFVFPCCIGNFGDNVYHQVVFKYGNELLLLDMIKQIAANLGLTIKE